MAYHHDLLAQAKALVRKEPTRPKQASLRRGVSAAYYALFHLLTDDASRRLTSGSDSDVLRELVQRSFVHSEMKRVSERFVSGRFSPPLIEALGAEVPADLRRVAKAFSTLQVARHNADYALSRRVARHEAVSLVEIADEAFAAWARVRKTPEARVYLTALLLGGRWGR